MIQISPKYQISIARVMSLIVSLAIFYGAFVVYSDHGVSTFFCLAVVMGVSFLTAAFLSELLFQLLFGGGLFLIFSFILIRAYVDGFIWLSSKFSQPVKIVRETSPNFYWVLFGFWSFVTFIFFCTAISAWRKLRKNRGINANGGNEYDNQKLNSYQKMISDLRTNEAASIWKKMTADGFNESTISRVDFKFFTKVREDAEALSNQLADNYVVTISDTLENGYWFIHGVTLPKGKKFTHEQFLKWIDFMIFTGFSSKCVFSTWAISDSVSNKTWSTKELIVN